MKHPLAMRGRAERRGGGPLILFALTAFVLVGLAGLALDLAWVESGAQQLQASADAASLAGARLVRQDSQASQFAATRNAAVQAALANTAAKANVIIDPNPTNAPTGDVVVGRWDPITKSFTPDTSQPDAVRVTARRTDGSGGGPLGLFFGQMFGVTSSNVARTAVARAELTSDPLVLLFSDGSKALDMRGTSDLLVPTGKVHLNSTADCGLSMSGTPTLIASSISVGGTACANNGTLTGALIEGAPPLADPLAQIPAPSFSAPAKPVIGGSGTYQPGYYGGIDMTQGTATLAPGVYVIGGRGIRLTGTARLQGDGVMLYLPKPADFEIMGCANVRLTGPQSGVYQGVTLFQDRTTATSNDIGGNATVDVEGACYLYCSSLDVDGNCSSPKAAIGQIIAWSMQLAGSAEVEVTGLGLRPPSTASKPILTQ
jgi:Flp pilus assembly protein TadG